MTTPPIELAATVERIERKEPPIPGDWIVRILSTQMDRWAVFGPFDTSESAERATRHLGSSREFIRISPAPSPAASGAVPVREIVALCEIAEIQTTLNEAGGYGVEPTKSIAAAVRAWLATLPGKGGAMSVVTLYRCPGCKEGHYEDDGAFGDYGPDCAFCGEEFYAREPVEYVPASVAKGLVEALKDLRLAGESCFCAYRNGNHADWCVRADAALSAAEEALK